MIICNMPTQRLTFIGLNPDKIGDKIEEIQADVGHSREADKEHINISNKIY